jgi:hypothetical protein
MELVKEGTRVLFVELHSRGLPYEFMEAAFVVLLQTRFERVPYRPENLLEHMATAEKQLASQRISWRSKKDRKAVLAAMHDRLHAAAAPEIVQHPQVQAEARTETEAKRGRAPAALGELFVRLERPGELPSLGAKPQAPGTPFAEKLKRATRRAESAERGADWKLGSGDDRRRPVELTGDDVSGAPEPLEVLAARESSSPAINEQELARVRAILSPRQLEAVVATLDAGGTTDAAKRLNKSPQAVQDLIAGARARLRKAGFDLKMKKTDEEL